ncbi:MAG: hypothetical protein SNI32_05345 [Rikenellaceae bacterium]
MTMQKYNYNAKAKEVQRIYKLRYKPTIMCDLKAALEWAEGCEKSQFVMLGDDCKYWVVCPADAWSLIVAGYEYAE